MKFRSQIVTAASGSIGGTTYSHNRGGMYQRARATPTNPNSPQQAAVRAIFTSLAVAWTQTLTTVQRAAWDLYAANVAVIDSLGDPIFITGMNHFIRSNTPRIQAGMTQVTVAPPAFDLGAFTMPSFTASAATQLLTMAFTNSDSWANVTGGAGFIMASRPQQPAINFFKGPYRFANKILGNAVPPASPVGVAAPFAFLAAQKLFVRFSVTQLDGRLSNSYRTGIIAGA